MRIVTWNVNGLRAALNKGALDWLREQAPDVVCLQEIKTRPEQIDQAFLDGIADIFPYCVWNPALRPGYSGVATFARIEPLEIHVGLGFPEFDNEGRVIVNRFPGLFLFNLYVPNGQHNHSRVPFKLDFYAKLLGQCDQLHLQGEQLIICGDINTAHNEIDLKNPKANENSTGFLPEERQWIDLFLEHGFVDIYRHLYPERVQYTWWTYRMNARIRDIGWRLDYFLVSQALLGCVTDTVIHNEVHGSDHCPVSLFLT
jgi:exodeoxyribonuclease-3